LLVSGLLKKLWPDFGHFLRSAGRGNNQIFC